MLCDFKRPAPPRVRYGLPRPQGNGPGTPCTGSMGTTPRALPAFLWTKSTGFPPCRPWPNTTRHPGKSPRQAPIRICPEERISGAATLGAAIDYAVPAAYRGACLFPGVNHLTIRYDRVLKEGLEAYKRDITARLALAADGQETAFLRSLDNVVEALRVWHAGYLDAVREEKPAVYRALQRVPFAPARNFLEAVQALWFIFAFVRLCGNWPGIGRIDWLLGDYLQKDLAAGVLTKPEAREILASFFIKGCEWIQSQPRPGSGGRPALSEHCSGWDRRRRPGGGQRRHLPGAGYRGGAGHWPISPSPCG